MLICFKLNILETGVPLTLSGQFPRHIRAYGTCDSCNVWRFSYLFSKFSENHLSMQIVCREVLVPKDFLQCYPKMITHLLFDELKFCRAKRETLEALNFWLYDLMHQAEELFPDHVDATNIVVIGTFLKISPHKFKAKLLKNIKDSSHKSLFAVLG